jgi:adenylate cyclase
MSAITPWQRIVRRRLHSLAGKHPDEPLSSEDWGAFFEHHTRARGAVRIFSALPGPPRCRICGAPFGGPGSRLVGPLGYRPSRKNPHMCATCIELAPPGGIAMDVGVLFADVRAFTSLSESMEPGELSALLRRLYLLAEEVLFPEALIDKLVGDQVMALYIPAFGRMADPIATMLDHARSLLMGVGYGSGRRPILELGVGLDFGSAFVGNIGDRWVSDFTAVGDVVNTASRLQGEARGGEIVLSERVVRGLRSVPGRRRVIELKGKREPVVAYRASVDAFL